MSKLLWLPINLLQAVFLAVWSVVWITAALVVRLVTGSTRIPLVMARRIWSPGLLAVGPVRLDVRGLENVDFSRPHLFVANHQSMIDIPAVFCALPVNLHFVVKEELRRVPFLGWYISAMKMVYVNRQRGQRSLKMIRQMEDLMRHGGSVLSFPEGTRSRDGAIRPFKSGVFVPALEAGLPVIPVAIYGAGKIIPPGGFAPRPGLVHISIGSPVNTEGLGPEHRRELASRTREALLALHDELARDAGATN